MVNIDTGTLITQSLDKSGNRTGGPETRDILGVKVSVYTKKAALDHMAQLIATKTHTKFSFLNAHTANIAWTDEDLRHDLQKFEVLSDGIGVDICSMINYGRKFPENLNGTDFVPSLLGHLPQGVSVALLGAEPGVADQAALMLGEKYPACEFNVISHGYFGDSEKDGILNRLSKLKPDILLVAFGNPVQEKWIAENCNGSNCLLAFGVGAYFDFVAGRVPRAPNIMRRLRLEWLYRLMLEPGRMWQRYVIGNPLFLMRSLKQKLGVGRNDGAN